MYQAIHADRYQRQGLIKAISRKTGRHLICYVSGLRTMIDRDDTVGWSTCSTTSRAARTSTSCSTPAAATSTPRRSSS